MALLKTKFLHPIVSDKTVERPRLDESLAPRAGKKAVFIIAPAGFGKTTLVAHWASRCNHQAAWLSLDASDNSPTNFWQYVIGALQQVSPALGTEALRQLMDETHSDCLPAVTSLLNELAEDSSLSRQSTVLVLDDYHLIENPAIHQALVYFLEHLPPTLQLILTSRTEPALPLSRWRVKGFIEELYTSDLTFSTEEISEFFRNFANLTLTPEEIERIQGATSGWIAALQLMILSQRKSAMSGSLDVASLLSGGKRLIDDYVLAEILSKQPRDIQRFLEDSASLSRINPDLCDYIRGTQNSREILTALEKSNLFIVPLDNRHYWYRYHDLFRDALLSRVTAFAPERIREFQRKAVDWYLTQDLYHEAVSQLLALEDWEWLIRVLEEKGNKLIRSGYHLYLMEWLNRLPSTLSSQSPKLLMLRAWCYFYDNKFESIEPQLAQLEILLSQPRQRHGLTSDEFEQIQNEISLVRAYLTRSHPDSTEASNLTRQVLEKIRDTDIPLKSVGYYGIALDYFRWGDLTMAVSSLESAIHHGQLEERYSTVLSSLGLLMWIQYSRGDLNHALSMNRAIQSWLDNFHRNQPQPALVSCWRNTALAEIYREQNNLIAAQAYLNPLLHFYEQAEPGQRMMIHYVQSGLAFSQGNHELALEHLDLAMSIHEQKHEQIMFEAPALHASKLRYFLAKGDIGQAELIGGHIIRHPSENPLNRQREQLSLARLYLAQQRHEETLNVLAQLLATAREKGYAKLEIQGMILMALTQHSTGQTDKALNLFGQALELAERTSSIRLFADESAQLTEFFSQELQTAASPLFQNSVLDALQRKAKSNPASELCTSTAVQASLPSRSESSSGVEEPISKRELEVLHLIHEGLANKQIASRLNLAPATVKAHIRNLYGKIGASSRTEALAKARKLGLLDSNT